MNKSRRIASNSLVLFGRMLAITVINLYAAGHPIDEIWKASGFRSRSSVFRILNKHGIKLNRGRHSGPIKKWDERKKANIKEDEQ